MANSPVLELQELASGGTNDIVIESSPLPSRIHCISGRLPVPVKANFICMSSSLSRTTS